MNKLYEYHEDFGRHGSLSGRILMDDEDLARYMGSTGHADEALGKHSEVPIKITEETLTLVTDDQAFLERAKELGVNLAFGFDPRDHVRIEDEDEDDEEEEETSPKL